MADVSRLDLERFVLGDLDADATAALRARIDADADLARRVARLERELDPAVPLPPLELPADPLPGATDGAGARAGAPGFPRWASLGAVALLLAAALALLVPRMLVERDDPTAFRGTFDLEVLRMRQGAWEPQGALVKARAGDRLQLVVRPQDASDRVSVFDVQDDGAVSVWADALPVGRDGTVPVSAILDDYPGL